jgi:hypothetical protein
MCYRRQDLHARAEADWALLHLPAFELENALHRVLVDVEQVSHGAITERRVLLDHCLDGSGEWDRPPVSPWSAG